MKKAIFLLSVFYIMTSISVSAQAGQELSMKDVYDFLKTNEVYYLATVDGDQPRVRPFGSAVIFEGKIYIQTGKIKNVSKQIGKNPKVEICALDKAGTTWIRIEAVLVNDERVEAKQFMLDAYPSLQSMYSATDDNSQVLYLKNATATFSSFSGETKVVKF